MLALTNDEQNVNKAEQLELHKYMDALVTPSSSS